MTGTSSSGRWNLQPGRRCWVVAVAIAILLPLALRSAVAQTQVPLLHRDVIVLDPAHGGTDTGARLSDSLLEKDVTLELATRLRSLLQARGFTVVSTRVDAGGAGLSIDQRAELANKSHAVACLVLHASASGNGVQIGSSTIGSPLSGPPESTGRQASGLVPWDRAQEVYVPQSLRLANKVGAALARSNVPLAIGRVALRPLDNLMCPAISIEMAPQRIPGDDPTPVSDAAYQQRVADAVAGALVFWRNQAQQPENVNTPKPDAQLIAPAHLVGKLLARGSGS